MTVAIVPCRLNSKIELLYYEENNRIKKLLEGNIGVPVVVGALVVSLIIDII